MVLPVQFKSSTLHESVPISGNQILQEPLSVGLIRIAPTQYFFLYTGSAGLSCMACMGIMPYLLWGHKGKGKGFDDAILARWPWGQAMLSGWQSKLICVSIWLKELTQDPCLIPQLCCQDLSKTNAEHLNSWKYEICSTCSTHVVCYKPISADRPYQETLDLSSFTWTPDTSASASREAFSS